MVKFGVRKAFLFALSISVTLVFCGCKDPLAGVEKTPNIVILQGTTQIPNGSGSYGFADTLVGSSAEAVFTIQNTGTGDLSLSGSPIVAVSGTDAAQFSITAQAAASVAPGASTSFTVRFAPTAAGAKTATLSIASNDPDENPRSFTLSGTGYQAPSAEVPEMNVKQGASDIPDGTGSYGYGSIAVQVPSDAVFTIENSGGAALNLTSSPIVQISGANADQFSVSAQPLATSVAAGATAAFTVRFTPTSEGAKTATISIANSDGDEGAYDFTVSGTGTASLAEIDIQQNSVTIPDGTGSYAFPLTGATVPADSVFTIRNLGTTDLVLTGSPSLIDITGASAAYFTVTAQPASVIAAGGSTSFTLRFLSQTAGSRTASLAIANNDANENPYNISLSARAMATMEPEIYVRQGSTSIADGTGSFAFSATAVGTSTDAAFTIENLGAQDLLLSGTPAVQIGGADAALFSVISQPAATVSGNGSVAFTLRFTPDSLGSKAATISIANNDPNENPYDFSISGPCTDDWYGLKTVDSATSVGSYGTAVGVSGDTILVSYYDETSIMSGRMMVARSTDSGATWTTSSPDTASAGKYSSLKMAGSSAYLCYSLNDSAGLKFAKSTDGGLTWPLGSIKTVATGTDWYSSLAVDGTNVYISYYGGSSDLMVAKSTDGGATWPAANIKTVDSTGTTGQYTSIAASGSDVYVSYYDFTNDDLKFAKSTDGGATWPTVTTLDSTGMVGTHTSIGLNGNEVYICYYDTTNQDLKLAKSANSGTDWSISTINDVAYTAGKYNSMAISGGSIYLSYQITDSNTRLRFATSTDGGATWSFRPVDANSYTGACTSIAVDGDKVYISEVETNADDLKFAKSIDGGDTW